MRRRFGTGAHLVNAISFALAQLLIAGINLYLLAQHRARAARLAAVGLADRRRGDRAHLHHPRRAVGGDLQRGAAVLRHRRRAAAADADRPAPGRRLERPDDKITAGRAATRAAVVVAGHRPDRLRQPVLVGRSASSSASASCCPSATGRRTSSRSSGRWRRTRSPPRAATPIIGVVPEDVRPVHRDHPGHDRRASWSRRSLKAKAGGGDRERRLQQLDALPDARRAAQRPAGRGDRRPARGVHGRHGGQHLRLQHGLQLRPVAALRRRRTGPTTTTCRSAGWRRSAPRSSRSARRCIASSYTNIMDYLQTLFGFFNAPLFATFILGMFWKRMTPTAGWVGPGLRHPGRRRRRVPQRGRVRDGVARCDPARRPGRQLRGRRRRVRRRHRGQRRGHAW